MPKTRTKTNAKRIRNKARAQARHAESFARATSNACPRTEAETIEHFAARGVPASEIRPRVNVFTFGAWKHKGRTVRKGERGCPLVVWIPVKGKGGDDAPSTDEKDNKGRGIRPKTTYVFHECQTVPVGHQDGAEPLPLAPDDPRVAQAVEKAETPASASVPESTPELAAVAEAVEPIPASLF